MTGKGLPFFPAGGDLEWISKGGLQQFHLPWLSHPNPKWCSNSSPRTWTLNIPHGLLQKNAPLRSCKLPQLSLLIGNIWLSIVVCIDCKGRAYHAAGIQKVLVEWRDEWINTSWESQMRFPWSCSANLTDITRCCQGQVVSLWTSCSPKEPPKSHRNRIRTAPMVCREIQPGTHHTLSLSV